jgi:hypothetical protein
MASNKNPFNLPTAKIDLPSKGLIYPIEHVLHQGFVEVVYPGAKQEDILTNSNYLDKGEAVDKYLDSVLLTEVSFEDFTPGDKDAVMIGIRILGMGKSYTTAITLDKKPEPVTFNITTLKEREVDFSLFAPGINEFSYTLVDRNVALKFKLLFNKDVTDMIAEEAGMKKLQKDYSADTSLFLKYAITEVNGDRNTKVIRDFVDRMLQIDTKELKRYITSVTPAYIWRADGVKANKEIVEDLFVPYTADFFWPL